MTEAPPVVVVVGGSAGQVRKHLLQPVPKLLLQEEEEVEEDLVVGEVQGGAKVNLEEVLLLAMVMVMGTMVMVSVEN